MKRRIFAFVLIICLLFTSTAFGASDKPAQVKKLKAVGDYGAVTLSFSKVKDAHGYKVYYSEDEDFGYKSALYMDNKITMYVEAGKTYYFKVRAYSISNGKTKYGPYSKVVMATARAKDPNFYMNAQNIDYGNDIAVYVGSYDNIAHYPITVDLYSFMLYDTTGKLLTTYLPTQYIYNESTSTTQQQWKNVDVTSFKSVNGNLLGIILKPQFGYVKPDLKVYSLVYTGTYNGEKYLFRTTNGKTEFSKINWNPTVKTTN